VLGRAVGKGVMVVEDGRGEGRLAGRFILSLCGPRDQSAVGMPLAGQRKKRDDTA